MALLAPHSSYIDSAISVPRVNQWDNDEAAACDFAPMTGSSFVHADSQIPHAVDSLGKSDL